MSKSLGGFLLIRINKELTDITSDDLQPHRLELKNIFINKIYKPVVFQYKSGCLLCSINSYDTFLSIVYSNIHTDDTFSIDISESLEFGYNAITDDVFFDYEKYEQ